MTEVLRTARSDNISIAQLAMANETSVSGRSEAEINAFLDKILGAMRATVKTGLDAPTRHAARADQAQDQGRRCLPMRWMQDRSRRGGRSAWSRPYALAGSEENARGHLVITAPTGGSAGVMPAVVYSLGEGGAKLSDEKMREGLLAAAVVGYLCKHNATLSAAEGGCQAEIGVASAMGAALIAQAYDERRRLSPTPPKARWSIISA